MDRYSTRYQNQNQVQIVISVAGGVLKYWFLLQIVCFYIVLLNSIQSRTEMIHHFPF